MSATGRAGSKSYRAAWHVPQLEAMDAEGRAKQIILEAGCMEEVDAQFYSWAAQYPSGTREARDYQRAVRSHLIAVGASFD